MADGRQLVSASVDGTARLWDVNSGQNTQTLAYHENKVYDAAVNEAGTQAVTVSSDKKIAVWDLRNSSQPMIVNGDDTRESITCCDFSNDQKSVITATFGGRVVILDLETQEVRVDYDIMCLQPDLTEDNMCYGLSSVKNHPEGGNIFVLSSGVGIPNVISYEGHHDEPLHRLATVAKYFGHKGPIRACEFSPNNSKMLSCAADHSMRVWSNDTFQTMKVLQGHTDLCTSGIWLNENTIVSGSWDCKILLWNI